MLAIGNLLSLSLGRFQFQNPDDERCCGNKFWVIKQEVKLVRCRGVGGLKGRRL